MAPSDLFGEGCVAAGAAGAAGVVWATGTREAAFYKQNYGKVRLGTGLLSVKGDSRARGNNGSNISAGLSL